MAFSKRSITFKIGSRIILQNDSKKNLENLTWTFNDRNVTSDVYPKKRFERKNARFKDSGIYRCISGDEVTIEYTVEIYGLLFGDDLLGIRITLTGGNDDDEPALLSSGKYRENQNRNSEGNGQPGANEQARNTGNLKTGEQARQTSAFGTDVSCKEAYSMVKNPRGVAVIITIMEFENLSTLRGMKMYDTENCIETFTALQFEIRECKVSKRENILKYLDQIAKEDHSQYDCFVLFVGSHGGDGFIACSNYKEDSKEGIISYSELLDPFLKNKDLEDKPKVLFFDSCRHYHFHSSKDQTPIKSVENEDDLKGYYSHVFVGYAAIIGTSAWGDNNGGFYNHQLTECLKEYASKLSLTEIMEVVRKNLKGQTAISESTLEKRLYFLKKQ